MAMMHQNVAAGNQAASVTSWLVILPNNTFIHWWDHLMQWLAVFLFVTVPVDIAFRCLERWSRGYYIATTTLDSLLIIDCLLYFIRAFVNTKSVLVTDLVKIRKNYLGETLCSSPAHAWPHQPCLLLHVAQKSQAIALKLHCQEYASLNNNKKQSATKKNIHINQMMMPGMVEENSHGKWPTGGHQASAKAPQDGSDSVIDTGLADEPVGPTSSSRLQPEEHVSMLPLPGLPISHEEVMRKQASVLVSMTQGFQGRVWMPCPVS